MVSSRGRSAPAYESLGRPARSALRVLRGSPAPKVGPDTGDTWVGSDRTDQCTHVIDLAAVAVAHADRPSVRYVARVNPGGGPRRHAVLLADGQPVLEWELEDDLVTAGPFAGLRVRSRELKQRMRELPDPDHREHVAILRRACHIAPSRDGRSRRRTRSPTRSASSTRPATRCSRRSRAPSRRVRGSARRTEQIF